MNSCVYVSTYIRKQGITILGNMTRVSSHIGIYAYTLYLQQHMQYDYDCTNIMVHRVNVPFLSSFANIFTDIHVFYT